MSNNQAVAAELNPDACMSGQREVSVPLLDRIVSRLFDTLMDRFGAHNLYLVGGTSQALMLAALEGRPLTLRDFDVAILGIKPGKKRIEEVAHGLELGPVSDFRPRPRGSINAGYGIYVNHAELGVVDLIFFNNRSALKANGLFSVDNICLRLCPERMPRDRAVSFLMETLRSEGVEGLAAKGLVYDRHRGAKDLSDRTIKLCRRGPYFTSPRERINALVRGVKQAAKWRTTLENSGLEEILVDDRELLAREAKGFAPTRNMVKVLSDRNLIESALVELRRTKALELLLPELSWVARCEERWSALLDELDVIRSAKDTRPVREEALDLMDTVSRRMASSEWASFSKRLIPVLGESVVGEIEVRRRQRVPTMLRIWDGVERWLSSVLPAAPVPVRRRRRLVGAQ